MKQRPIKKFIVIDRLRSFKYAHQGIKSLFLEEHNARVHLVAGTMAIILGFLLQISSIEWLFIFSAIAFVLVTETINSAIEGIVDMVCPEYDPFAGKVKDFGAGAVLIAVIYSVIVAAIIFIPHLFELI